MHRTTILMYEIGTGNPASEILSVFDISEMRFSSNGRYLALASTSGSVSIWALSDHPYLTVSQILEVMQSTVNYWHNFPIFLPDAEDLEIEDQDGEMFAP